MNTHPNDYEWPDDVAPPERRPGPIILIVLYASPFLILLLFPSIAWIALLPLTPLVRATSHSAHRRPLTWIYLLTGLVSFAPWLTLLAR